MADSKSPVFSSPAYWVALTAGVVGIGAAAWSERKGSGSMARAPKITQNRLDKDEALFERRFGGLVTEENGSPIEIAFNDVDAIRDAEANRTLWTHVDGDGDGATYLMPGATRVNRIAYHLSYCPWTDDDLTSLEIAWTN